MAHLIDSQFQEEGKKVADFYNSNFYDFNAKTKYKKKVSNYANKILQISKTWLTKINRQGDSFQAYVQIFLTKILFISQSNTLKYENVLLHNDKPFTVHTKSMRISGLSQILQCNKQMHELTVTLNVHNGLIHIKNCTTLTLQSINDVISFKCVIDRLMICLTQNYEMLITLFKQLSNDFNMMKKNQILQYFDHQYDNNKINLALKYAKISFIELDISSVEPENKKTLQKNEIMERKKIHNHIPLNISDYQINKSLSLFQISQFSIESLEYMVLSEEEIQSFNSYLKWPKPQFSNEYENQYIFNQIIIENPEKAVCSATKMSGGRSQLYATLLRFQYPQSPQIKQIAKKNKKVMIHYKNQQQQPTKTLQKVILVKMPLKNSLSSTKYQQHEIQILSLLRLAASGYLLKYYKTEQNCKFKSRLMMDFPSNSMDLQTYAQKHKSSISITTKLFLLSSISNGLRFLRNNKIVHMDLTPKNILVVSGLITKIIDFGQAYSPRVCKEQYKPGFTNPYGPPQVFTQNVFTTKQDIFSFGIILFKLLFDQLPFNPTQKLKQTFMNKTYNSKMYFALESLQYIWLQKPMLLLFSLFERCKNVDPLNRPYPTWIRIILRFIIDWADAFNR